MKRLTSLLIALTIAFATQMQAQDSSAPDDTLGVRQASDVTLEQFLWTNRLLVVFADTDRDPAFAKQMDLLLERPDDLLFRDVVVITDTDPALPSEIREKLRPRGFGLVLIDKDGLIKLRKPSPWDVREISRSIDKTDLRQQELRDMRAIPPAK